jgi:pyridoxine 5-phosphate synthase
MVKRKKRVRLGVNIDHCATLRQVRGGETPYPDIPKMAQIAVKNGAEQITIHLREDRRHIQDHDLRTLCQDRPAILNLEMAVTREMLKIALQQKPDWVCFVPEKRQELTTEGGLDVIRAGDELKMMIPKLQNIGIEVSLFIDADPAQVLMAAQLGAEAVEFHTGHWCQSLQAGHKTKANASWKRLVKAAKTADALGLGVHAGHGLDYDSTLKILKLPYLREVNIGHSLVCYALEVGLGPAVRKMRRILDRA